MAYKYTNHDHYCHWCGKRIEDGEDYIRDAYNTDYCEKCWDENGGVDHRAENQNK